MKIFSKFILTVLCANLTFGCFAGGNASRERAEQENERTEQEFMDRMKKMEKLGAVGFGLLAVAAIAYACKDDNRERPVAQRANDAVEERKEQPEPIRRPIALAPASSSTQVRKQGESSGCIQESACRISKNASSDLPSIKLDDITLNSLRDQFDNKLMTPSCWGPSKDIRFDYQHIFVSKPKGKNGFKMGHTDARNILYKHKQLLGIKFTGYGPCGSYGYRWGEHETLNTFFPDNWSNDKIMSKINEAIKNRITKVDRQSKAFTFDGKTSEGLTIRIVFEAKDGQTTGKVKSVYPIID